jgi:hypothetical protein
MRFLLHAPMEAALLEVGCGPSPWYTELKVVLQVTTNTWTSSFMSFIAYNCFDLHHNIMMDGYSQKDSFLMANFIKQGASSPKLTSMMKYCTFLIVSRMSEVVTGCGSRILLRMYNGEEQGAIQLISGQSNQDHQKGHGRYVRSTWGLWWLHKQHFP